MSHSDVEYRRGEDLNLGHQVGVIFIGMRKYKRWEKQYGLGSI